MKKFVFVLMSIPLIMMMSGCGDDNDYPDFDVEVAFGTGVTLSGDVVTVVQGTPLVVESVTPINYDATNIVFGTVTYIIDYSTEFITNVAPFTVSIETESLPVGPHLLQITFPVFAVDYSIFRAMVTYTLNVVEPSDDTNSTTGSGGRLVANPKITSSN